VLRELQRDLAASFLSSGIDSAAARRVQAVLVPVGGVATARSVQIYQRSVRAAVGRALAEIFPVCLELVGEDCFRGIARHHTERSESRHPDLARIGDPLPGLIPQLDFLDSVPYLADVARIELALHHAASAQDARPVDEPERIADALGAEPGAWCLVLPPSATLIESAFPARAIWHAHRAPDRDADRFEIAPASAVERTIVWRSPEGLRVDEVEAGLWWPLRASAQGDSVSQLLAQGEDRDGGIEATLDAIARLFERRWIVGVAPVAAARGNRFEQSTH